MQAFEYIRPGDVASAVALVSGDPTAQYLAGGTTQIDLMLKDGVLIRSLAVHHARRSYLRVTVGTRQQNERCVAAFERVLGRQGRRETPRPFLTVAGDAE